MTQISPATATPPQWPAGYQPRPDDDEIDLADLFRALWQGRWWILLSSLVATMLAVAIALWLPNIYRADVKLAPSAEQQGGGLGALAGQFGGLASLAGINLSGGQTDAVGVALEVAKSRQFVAGFIKAHQLAVPLMAAVGIDKQTGDLKLNADLYDVKSGQWVRQVTPPKSVEPSNWELYKAFSQIFNIEQDKKSGLVTASIEFYSPELSRQWLEWLVADLNEVMKRRDIHDAERNIAYLKLQLEKTANADMQTVFYKLIEEQTKTLMLADVNQEYVFKTLDPAVTPEEKAKPKRALMVVLGTILGGMLGVMWVLGRHALQRASNKA